MKVKIPRQIIIHWKKAPGIDTYLEMDPYPLEKAEDLEDGGYWIIDNKGFRVTLVQKIKGVTLHTKDRPERRINISLDNPGLPEKVRNELIWTTGNTISASDLIRILGKKTCEKGVIEDVVLGFQGGEGEYGFFRIYDQSDPEVLMEQKRQDIKSGKYKKTKKWMTGHKYYIPGKGEYVFLGEYHIYADKCGHIIPNYYTHRKDSNIHLFTYYPEPGKEIPKRCLFLYSGPDWGIDIEPQPGGSLKDYLLGYLSGPSKSYLSTWEKPEKGGFPIAYDMGEVFNPESPESFTEMRDKLLWWALKEYPVSQVDPTLPKTAEIPYRVVGLDDELDIRMPEIPGVLCNISENPLPEIGDKALIPVLWEREKTLIKNSLTNEILLVYRTRRWRNGAGMTDHDAIENFTKMTFKQVGLLELNAFGTPKGFRDGRIRYITEVLGIPREDLIAWTTETFKEVSDNILKQLEDGRCENP
jgi:hypothetical protein